MTFIVVGVFLGVVGAGDLLRAARDLTSMRRRVAILGFGWALLALGVLALGPGAPGVPLWLGLAAAYALWLLGSSAALAGSGLWEPSGHPGAARALAFAGLGAGIAVGLVGAEVSEVPDWPSFLDETALARWPVQDVVVAVGAVLVQLATANVLVRLLLDSVGVPATRNEKQLKGGRVLGPMERVFIVGLGAIGEVTAAAIVVAAKGLLRFPELQRAVRLGGEDVLVEVDPHHLPAPGDPRDLPGPTDVTEYFLIGSFASWLVALAGVALIYLA